QSRSPREVAARAACAAGFARAPAQPSAAATAAPPMPTMAPSPAPRRCRGQGGNRGRRGRKTLRCDLAAGARGRDQHPETRARAAYAGPAAAAMLARTVSDFDAPAHEGALGFKRHLVLPALVLLLAEVVFIAWPLFSLFGSSVDDSSLLL